MTQPPAKPTIHLYSFGFQYSGPPVDPEGHGGFVFDCRALPNPFWEEPLRPFPGTDPRIVAWFAARPEVEAYARHATELVLYTVRTYERLARPHLQVAFGCTGGRHRSVYQAERLRQELERLGFPIVLRHTDLAREAGGERLGAAGPARAGAAPGSGKP